MSAPTLPPQLQQLRVPMGVHNRWLSLLIFGAAKTGKSTFAASLPKPLLALDCGDGGIGLYLPKDDPDYQCLEITNPNHFQEAVEYALANQDYFNSVVVDPATLLWTDTLDFWNEELGGDIRGGDWRKVKGPWKAAALQLRRAHFHIAYTAQLRDLEYTEGPAGPGEKGKLEIKPQEVPAIEKNLPYLFDFIFQTDVKKGRLNQPTDTHKVTYWGGRRPASVPPTELYVGRQWMFNARMPEPVWDKVIGPLLPKWEEGATEFVGVDPKTARAEEKAAVEAAEDYEVGRLCRLIDKQVDLVHYRDHIWPTEIAPWAAKLGAQGQEQVRMAHEKKKAALAGVKA